MNSDNDVNDDSLARLTMTMPPTEFGFQPNNEDSGGSQDDDDDTAMDDLLDSLLNGNFDDDFYNNLPLPTLPPLPPRPPSPTPFPRATPRPVAPVPTVEAPAMLGTEAPTMVWWDDSDDGSSSDRRATGEGFLLWAVAIGIMSAWYYWDKVKHWCRRDNDDDDDDDDNAEVVRIHPPPPTYEVEESAYNLPVANADPYVTTTTTATATPYVTTATASSNAHVTSYFEGTPAVAQAIAQVPVDGATPDAGQDDGPTAYAEPY